MIAPKGTVADHWTWYGGKACVTGWHVPAKRKRKAEDEHQPSGRGIVREARPVQEQLL